MPDTPSVELQRDELYELAWSEPMVWLAKRYGITDVALAKVCRKMDIPVPPRGHWRRKEMGWRVDRPSLPKLRLGVRVTVKLTPRRPESSIAEPSPEIQAQEAFEREPKNRIRVARQLADPHPLVSHTASALRAKKPDSYGTIGTWREKCLDLRVSPKALDRALRIMNALLGALEARGFRITVSATDKPETHVAVLAESLQLRLEEKINRTPHIPTKDEARYPSSTPR